MADRTVSTRYVPLTVATPAATPAAAPLSTPIDLGDVLWEDVRIVVPSGHSGLTGIRFEYAGEPIIPWGRPPGWLVLDSFSDTFDAGFNVSARLTVVTYNTDFFAHNFYLYFRVSDRPVPVAPASALIVPISPH